MITAIGCNKVGSKREVLLVIDTFVERETDLGFKPLDFPFFLLREDGGTHEYKTQDKKQSFHSEKEIKIKHLVTYQFNCESTEEDEFDNIKNQTEDEPFRVGDGLHDFVVVRHRQEE